jgi:hypothetical protein
VSFDGSRRFAQAGFSAALVLFVVCSTIVIVGPRRILRARTDAGAPRFAMPGAPALPFRLPDLDARLQSLDDFRGRVVLMCITDSDRRAVEVLPALHDAVEPFHADQRVQAVTVFRTGLPPGAAELAQLRMDMASAGLRCPTLLDVTSDVSRDYRAARGTSLFVIDPAGVIRHRADEVERHPRAFADARQVVAALLRDSAGAGPSPLATALIPRPGR